MARTANDIFGLRGFILAAICLMWVSFVDAKELSDKELQTLIGSVHASYNRMHMEGSSIYNIKKHNVLVTIVGVKKTANMQRVAQIKATRSTGEFLKGALNKGVTVYEASETDGYSLTDSAIEESDTHNTMVSAEICQDLNESSTHATEEKFSDTVIQSSISMVDRIAPLCRLGTDDGKEIFAYYMLMPK